MKRMQVCEIDCKGRKKGEENKKERKKEKRQILAGRA